MNYGKRCLIFLTHQQSKEGWQYTRHTPDKKLKRKYTVKQWKKFDIDKQMYITKLYHVILTNHMTKDEKIKSFLNKFNLENTKKGIDTVQKNIDTFSKTMNEFSIAMGKDKDMSFLTGPQKKKDYSFLSLKG